MTPPTKTTHSDTCIGRVHDCLGCSCGASPGPAAGESGETLPSLPWSKEAEVLAAPPPSSSAFRGLLEALVKCRPWDIGHDAALSAVEDAFREAKGDGDAALQQLRQATQTIAERTRAMDEARAEVERLTRERDRRDKIQAETLATYLDRVKAAESSAEGLREALRDLIARIDSYEPLRLLGADHVALVRARAALASHATGTTDDETKCLVCGYTRSLHRAYASIDSRSTDLKAYLGGRFHPFSAPSPAPGAETATSQTEGGKETET